MVIEAVEEECGQVTEHRFRAFINDLLHDAEIGGGMVLKQNFADDAHPNLLCAVHRHSEEVAHHGSGVVSKAPGVPGGRGLSGSGGPALNEALRIARFKLVRANMKRKALQHVAVERCEHEALEAAEPHVKGLRAFNASARKTHNGHSLHVKVFKCPPQQRRVVCGTAGAAGLSEEERTVVGIYGMRLQSVKKLPDHDDCRVAGIVVHVL